MLGGAGLGESGLGHQLAAIQAQEWMFMKETGELFGRMAPPLTTVTRVVWCHHPSTVLPPLACRYWSAPQLGRRANYKLAKTSAD